jgi:hypothetical protein
MARRLRPTRSCLTTCARLPTATPSRSIRARTAALRRGSVASAEPRHPVQRAHHRYQQRCCSARKLSGQDSLPFATIGNQHLKGFGADSWDQYLSAAGYPKQPQLPKNYKAPAAKPLTVPAPAATDAAKPAERPAARITAPAAPPRAHPHPTTPQACASRIHEFQ